MSQHVEAVVSEMFVLQQLKETRCLQPKPKLDVDEDDSRPLKKARALCAMPTDESLKDTAL